MGKAGKTGKKKQEKGWLDGAFGNLLFLAIAGGIGYCRYHGIQVPILDNLILKLKGSAGVGGGYVDEAAKSFSDAKAGKSIAVTDLLTQLNRYCGRRGACTEEYWEALPDVASALKMGPGTWDRKPLKKAQASEIDELLVKLAKRPEATSLTTWKALRSMSKEVFDVAPKSMKQSLACRLELESATPPTKSAAPEKVEVEEIVVDDLS
eukprot:gb/GFBE01026439.1/.p1 GENE.gb/GFBE01026439.1/~~gb/GFBE01026439.1/.p1  ORF type:complete len:208 (+),score=55.97 gb/GFBE01026439.1/:1-624(+)